MGARNGLSSASNAKKHSSKRDVLQVCQKNRSPVAPRALHSGLNRETPLHSELPSSELQLAEQPWPEAELFGGRMVWQVTY